MTAAFAPPPWPAPAVPAGLRWHFGHEVWLQDGPQGRRPATRWLFRRNCSLSPAQLGAAYGALCTFSLAIALLFLWQGVPLVLAFAGLELLLVGVAMLVFARHAGDRETLTLDGRVLQVEQRHGSRLRCTQFSTDWVAVEPAAGQGSLVKISGQGSSVRVGRFLRPELRGAFARELRHALRRPATPVLPASPYPRPHDPPGAATAGPELK